MSETRRSLREQARRRTHRIIRYFACGSFAWWILVIYLMAEGAR